MRESIRLRLVGRVDKKCEKRLLASNKVCLSIRSSVRMEQLGCHGMDFRENLCLKIP